MVGAPRRRGFTLIELLVVVAILAVLTAILLPSLASARERARATVCAGQLHGVLSAVHAYASDYLDAVVPSYTMRGISGSALNPFEGWGPILHQARYLDGRRDERGNVLYCPNTLDRHGVRMVETGTDADNPLGYMDWPAIVTITSNYGTTIPRRGFNEILRVSYWINGDNPNATPRTFIPHAHFTCSVGYGPDPEGKYMTGNSLNDFAEPSRLIALADGLYSGNQQVTRLGDRDLRIGYRHPGRVPTANVGFADGHVGAIRGDRFPRKMHKTLDPVLVRDENLGSGPTLYSDPMRIFRDYPDGP